MYGGLNIQSKERRVEMKVNNKIKSKVICTKNLVHGSGTLDFKKDGVYDVIEKGETWLLLRNEWGQRHSITDEWMPFFTFINT